MSYLLDAMCGKFAIYLRMCGHDAGYALDRDVENDDSLRELAVAGVDLALADEPARCGQCNGALEAIEMGETTPEYAPDPSERRVWRCVECGQRFWQGSHWKRVGETLADAREMD